MKIGDVVVLKSGGPEMTVTRLFESERDGSPWMECMWFPSHDVPPEKKLFPRASLRDAKESKPDQGSLGTAS